MKLLWAFLASLFVLISHLAMGEPRPVQELTSGDYPALATILGKISYEPQTLRKLTAAKLIWFDEQWFRSRGFAVPAKLTAAFEKEILAEVAWAVPIDGEPLDAYGPETRVFYSDRYGGKGINGHRGSGRAASKGSIQIKGVGRTSLLNGYLSKSDEEHSTGRVDLWEGVNEVIASQVANTELPYGANRVIALVDAGTEFWDSSRRQWVPRVLVVREDPLRPAHFIINTTAKRTQIEAERMNQVMQSLDRALPQPAGIQPQSREKRLRSGIQEVIFRHARVAAYSYAHRFLHSAFSPSNEGLDGSALDFGAFMALEGYARAGRVVEGEYNGETKAVENVLREFLASLKLQLPYGEKGLVPNPEEAVRVFRKQFDQELSYEMVVLAGFPTEFLASVREDARVRALGAELIALAKDGNAAPIDALNSTIGRPGSYDMARIFQRLASTAQWSSQQLGTARFNGELDVSLRSEILDEKARARLIKFYGETYALIAQKGRKAGVAEASLRQYVALASDLRNRRTAHLINDPVASEYWHGKIDAYLSRRSPSILRKAIGEAVSSSRSNFADAEPLTLVVRERLLPGARFERDVFNLRTGRLETVSGGAESQDCAAPLRAKPKTY